MTRLLIVVPVYLLMATLLPQLGAFQPLLETLRRIPSQTSATIAFVALGLAISILFGLSRLPAARMGAVRSPFVHILSTTAIGLAFSSVFDLFELMGGRAINPTGMVVVTAAFTLSEIVYQSVLAIVRYRRQSPVVPSDVSAQPETGRNGLRLIVTIPIYVFVLVFLPQQPDFERMIAPLNELRPDVVAWICAGALLVAIAGPAILYGMVRQQHSQSVTGLRDMIILSGSLGLGFAALLNIVSFFTGYKPDLSDLLVIPVGFVLAEIVYFAIRWRLARGPYTS